MISLNTRLTIDRLGKRGEGIAQGPDGLIFIPYALADETIIAEADGSRGTLVEVLIPSPDRIEPFCRYFSRCGGCAVQTLSEDSYARWKRDLVVTALQRAGLTIEVSDLVDAHGTGRRRATFHALRAWPGKSWIHRGARAWHRRNPMAIMHFRKLRGTDSLWKRFERFDRSQYHIKRGLGSDKKGYAECPQRQRLRRPLTLTLPWSFFLHSLVTNFGVAYQRFSAQWWLVILALFTF